MARIRETELKELMDQECEFIGKMIRTAPIHDDSGEEIGKTTLVSPLYVKKNDNYVYVDHAWIKLPEDYQIFSNHIFEFKGIVKRRTDIQGKKKIFIEFTKFIMIRISEKEYNGLSMETITLQEIHDTNDRRNAYSNQSIIRAYELGQELPNKLASGDGTKEYLRLMESIKNGRNHKTPKGMKLRMKNGKVIGL